MKTNSVPCLLLTLLLSPCCAVADEQPNPKQPMEKQTLTDAERSQIDSWVQQLDHQRLTKRVQAKKKLLAAGSSAVPALAKAALSDKREAIERSIDVLGSLSQSEDNEAATAARVTLQMLSESDRPSTAERARRTLNTKPADGIQPFAGWDQAGNPLAGGGSNRSVSVSSVNGVRTIRIQEDGQNLVIEERPGTGIAVRRTGGGEPIELLAKNADDLKKRLPEVHAVYQQYTSGQPVGGMAFGQLGGLPFGAGVPGNVQNAGQAFSFSSQGGIGGMPASRDRMIRQLQELKKRMAGNAVMQQMLDQQIKSVQGKTAGKPVEK
ncbi:MAG: hypothetical protein NXI04_07930 [Planctomycetaceae bacterium]|nr:hypothetical protein [Planctomycetaceae bacterium]